MPILEDGQLFERYRVHRWLGSGIAGESYEAEDRILQRKVTLKLVHPWSALSDAARRQFFREMQGISLLNHPYLATVLDYGETDGQIYIARRYVSSGSLLSTNGRLWFHPPLAVADAFTYAHQLAQALQYIHQHGYLHGALTFTNVLVLRGLNTERDPNYAPFLVADVGLTNFVRRFGQPRIETLPISTAPEQLSRRVTPASDQFALAVLLYFWLSGRPPYLGTPQEVEQQKLSEAITPLSILNPGITLEQDTIILRALTAYPEDRYPSVLAFTETLLASLHTPGHLRAQPLPPPPETPSTSAPALSDTTPANTPQPAEPEGVSQPAQSALDQLAEEMAIAASPAQAEPYRSALEELLALPQRDTHEDLAETEAQDLEDEQEAFPAQAQEEIIPFPTLPETPPVGEVAEQLAFASLPPDDTTDRPGDRHTGPLDLEMPGDILHADLDDVAQAMPLELPENSNPALPHEAEPALPESSNTVFPATLPPALKEPPLDYWPDELDEEEIPTVPHEEFARAMREHAQLDLPAPASATLQTDLATETSIQTDAIVTQPQEERETRRVEEHPSNDEVSPSDTLAHTPLASRQESYQATSQKDFAVDEEGFVIFSPDEFASFHEMVSPVVFPDEPSTVSDEDNPVVFEDANFTSEEQPQVLPQELSSETANVPTTPPMENAQEQQAADAGSSSEEEEQAQLPEQAAPDEIPASEPTLAETPEETPSTSPLAHLTDTQAEEASNHLADHTPLPDANEMPDEEDMPTEPQTISPLVHEDAQIAAEEPLEQAVAEIPAPSLNEEAELPPRISTPLQEAPETSSATYPPIDEAIVAPRLLISSPYTSSSYEFLLIGEETHIGRAGASDLYLEQDDLTSRHHALLKRAGDRVLIIDKHSHNGVFLNGQKIEAGRGYELADGDHIGIGNYELIFRSAPAGHIPQLI